MHSILFVSSEVHSFIKTGGLADVSASLPHALAELGRDVRILLPAYADVLAQTGPLDEEAAWSDPVSGVPTRLLRAQLPDSPVPVWLLDAPGFSDRPGNPYLAADGSGHADNAERFDRLARAATAIAGGFAGLDWQPEVVHCNDWQTGLIPVHLLRNRIPAASVFTIHNLRYQGIFAGHTYANLRLPGWLWHSDGLEFYEHLSFIKGGLGFADQLTTVSPTYAQEIQTPGQGWELEGLLQARSHDLHGILNGIDTRAWDPQADPHLPAGFHADDLSGKTACKHALQEEMGLEPDPGRPILAVISRLAEQKGIDLMLAAMERLLPRHGVQLALLGSGEHHYEATLGRLAELYPGRVGLRFGFDEGLAHRIEAGSDMFLMPSRFEPCGLNQFYSLRYGTVPVVRAVGGLADSVVDATPDNLASGRATGILFDDASGGALAGAVERGLALYDDPDTWHQLRATGMRQDFSWHRSAERYLDVYQAAVNSRPLL